MSCGVADWPVATRESETVYLATSLYLVMKDMKRLAAYSLRSGRRFTINRTKKNGNYSNVVCLMRTQFIKISYRDYRYVYLRNLLLSFSQLCRSSSYSRRQKRQRTEEGQRSRAMGRILITSITFNGISRSPTVKIWGKHGIDADTNPLLPLCSGWHPRNDL